MTRIDHLKSIIPLRCGIVAEEASRKTEKLLFCESGALNQSRVTQAGDLLHHARGMPTARIFRRRRSPMQSGRARGSTWFFSFEPRYRAEIGFLMGWTGSRDTLQQVELRFSTLDEAVAFAKRQGFAYAVEPPRRREVHPKSYADNFRHDRLLPWTH